MFRFAWDFCIFALFHLRSLLFDFKPLFFCCFYYVFHFSPFHTIAVTVQSAHKSTSFGIFVTVVGISLSLRFDIRKSIDCFSLSLSLSVSFSLRITYIIPWWINESKLFRVFWVRTTKARRKPRQISNERKWREEEKNQNLITIEYFFGIWSCFFFCSFFLLFIPFVMINIMHTLTHTHDLGCRFRIYKYL